VQHLKDTPYGKLLNAELKRNHNNIATQLRTFREPLKESMPRFYEHLKSYLRMEYPCFRYAPPSGTPRWNIS
jgi:hypothetical protein